MRILLAEDDPLLGDGLRAGLRQAGFLVDWVQDGEAALVQLHDAGYGAMVLDLGLPRIDGLDILRRARADGIATPILVLTARDAIAQRVSGLDHGADDYLVKPADLHELAARLRALIRRAHGRPQEKLSCGALTLDPAARTVQLQDEALDLTAREFDLLQALMLATPRLLSREQLAQQLYQWGSVVESNTVEVQIHHLRRKIGPERIQTLRGVGYRLLAEPR
ncbi:response regulator transcription factor [Paucibacter sp. APW11]|uniref:Response regulator transcription factor n=1 Tax=Roseateles aquae TaxID=3077235 RepID=A0ABU3PI39_9BURK|nr:response regulator transcription factor [Paucibacter sp. APW11]MDT9001768.1 response regulator transcription factor [Paucibacter sp. APW11]